MRESFSFNGKQENFIKQMKLKYKRERERYQAKESCDVGGEYNESQ